MSKDAITEDTIANGLFVALRSQSIAIANRFTPARWFECDVLQITRAGYAIEHEIKCSRADFLADARKGEYRRDRAFVDGRWILGEPKLVSSKHDRIAAADEHAPSRFYFVAPKDLIGPDDLPPWAGLKYATPGINERTACVRVVKRAPEIHRRAADEKLIQQMNRNLAMRYWWDRMNRESA